MIEFKYNTATGDYDPASSYVYQEYSCPELIANSQFILTTVQYGGLPALRITNAGVTNANSWKIIPTSSYIAYASNGQSNDYTSVTEWEAKPSWNIVYVNDFSNRKLVVDTETVPGLYILYNWDTNGFLPTLSSELTVAGDGAVHTLARVFLEFDPSII